MQIAFVLSLPYAPVGGGAERWIADAAEALRAHASVSEHYLDPDHLIAPRDGVVRHAALRPPLREGDRLALSPGLLRAVAGADVVHVHQYGSLMTQLLALIRRARRRPLFVTDHGSSGLVWGNRLGLSRLPDGFICQSRFAAEQVGSAPARVVNGGVSTERFRPGTRAEQPFALFVGRLLPHKGVDWLIRSLPEGARLVVAGRPDEAHAPGYLALLRQLAVGHDVSFVLDPGDEEISRLYGSAWVTVLPSVWTDVHGQRKRVPELLGLTLIESMSSGTPVIASRLGPLPEVAVEPGGELVEPGDEQALRAALSRRLSDRAGVENDGAAARARVLEEFTWPKAAEELLRAYRELGRDSR